MEQLFQQLINGLVLGSTYAAVAVGFGVTFSVLRVINLAHPSFLMIATFIAIVVTGWLGTGSFGIVAVVIITIAIMIALALVLERLVLRPVGSAPPIMTLIATAGAAIVLESGVARYFGPDSRPFPSLVETRTLSLGGIQVSNVQMINFVLAVGATVAVTYFVKRTSYGLATRAVADNPQVTATFGVNTIRVAQVAVVISALMAGFAGLGVGLLYAQTSAFIGLTFGLKSFVCMLVAGNRHIAGIAVVGLALGVLEALIVGYISSTWRDAIAYLALIGILVLRPRGIFGSYAS